jgi:hypothetical protein
MDVPGQYPKRPHPKTENQAADNRGPQDCRFDGQLDQAQVLEQVDPHTADKDCRQHELQNRHIHQAQGTNLLVVSQHLPPLQKKAKQNPGNQTVKKLIRSFFTSRYKRLALTIPPMKKQNSAMNPLTAS